MDKDLLLQQFDLLATAPGGVAKLRELILTLAVQGKLVPQDPADEPASELLKRIRAEKDRLVAEGKIKRAKPLAPIGEGEQPFELPQGWEWQSLAEVGTWAIGSGFPHEAQGRAGLPILFAKVSDMNLPGNELEIVRTNHTIDEETVEKLRINVHPAGTVVFPKIGGAIATNKRRILVRPTAIDNNCLGITPSPATSTCYLFQLLSAIDFTDYQAGTSVPALSQGTLGQIAVGLPPLPEQARIVARVEELMRVCDELEAKGQQQAAHHRQLVQTLLGTLADANRDPDSATPTPDAWQRVAAHFDTLLDRPSAVDALEQTILQLAVRGQLVPQEPTDEPASELLKRIRTEKDRQIAEGKIKRDKPLAPIAEDEQPFELPVGWQWVRFGSISEFTNGFAFPSSEFSEDSSGVGVVKIGDIQDGVVSVASMSYVSQRYASRVDAGFIVEPGDMLIAMSGATTGKLGFNRRSEQFLLNQRVGKIALHLVRKEFAHQYLTTKIAENLSISAGSAIPNLSTAQIKEIAFPLPPLAEQSRIVARVEELRQVCNDLRQLLSNCRSTQAHLAEMLTGDMAAS